MEVGKDQMLEEMFQERRTNICAIFSLLFFIPNMTESKNGSIYLMIWKKRGKILGKQKQKLFETVKDISEFVYKTVLKGFIFLIFVY